MDGFPPDYSNSGFRYFTRPFDTNRGSQSFTLLYDASLTWYNGQTLTTGGWRPALPSDFAAEINVSGLDLTVGAVAVTGTANVSVINTAPIPVSGVTVISSLPSVTIGNAILPISGAVTASVAIGDVAVTGGQIAVTSLPSVTIGNPVVPVSGVVTTSVAVGDVAVTGGSIAISNAILPISGVVTTSVSVGDVAVTGGSIAVTSLPSVTIGNTAPIPISGVVTTSVTTDNSQVILAINTGNQYLEAISGQLASNLSDPVWVTGNVTVVPPSATSTNNSSPSGAPSPWASMTVYSTGTALALNAARNMFFVQNIHTGIPLYVNLGTAAANTGNFSMILNPSSNTSWGGSSFADDHYKGAVTVSGGSWIAWEI